MKADNNMAVGGFARRVRGVATSAILGLSAGALSGCVTPPPRHPGNICDIFREKRNWYYAAMRQEARWHIPASIPMAMMKHESAFRADARTRRTHILWIIPWKRITTAYGYGQIENGVWREYQRSTGAGGSRTNYADALQFMNWYITTSHKVNGIPLTDAMKQYLAYHEGWGGYRRRSYANKAWLIGLAKQVDRRAHIYQKQFDSCKEDLKGSLWERFWHWLF